MLMEELFALGIMTMGPAGDDPGRQVGVFNPNFIAGLAAARAAELEKFRWLAGEWTSANRVPATALSPSYIDTGTATFRLCEKGGWICMVGRDGRERPQITFDAFSRQWIFLLYEGAYGMLRSPGWSGDRIVFTGRMTMLGVECCWRMTWTKTSDDRFGFVNEERQPDGSWGYIDEWEFERRRAGDRS